MKQSQILEYAIKGLTAEREEFLESDDAKAVKKRLEELREHFNTLLSLQREALEQEAKEASLEDPEVPAVRMRKAGKKFEYYTMEDGKRVRQRLSAKDSYTHAVYVRRPEQEEFHIWSFHSSEDLAKRAIDGYRKGGKLNPDFVDAKEYKIVEIIK